MSTIAFLIIALSWIVFSIIQTRQKRNTIRRLAQLESRAKNVSTSIENELSRLDQRLSDVLDGLTDQELYSSKGDALLHLNQPFQMPILERTIGVRDLITFASSYERKEIRNFIISASLDVKMIQCILVEKIDEIDINPTLINSTILIDAIESDLIDYSDTSLAFVPSLFPSIFPKWDPKVYKYLGPSTFRQTIYNSKKAKPFSLPA